MSDPTELSLTEAAAMIAARKLSSREATLASLAAIERWQGKINAFIRIDGETALASADAADKALAAGRLLGPLHGVPLAHKDMFYRAGTVATCGSRIRRDFVPDATATVLTRLDEAGALQLGTLNMAEFAYSPSGHNDHFGHCRNPWNPLHITGGSSSGSGAAVAARLCHGALGSDTGGSIRTPSSICNLVGMKTTTGRVSRAGAMPLSHSLDTVGPMARTVRDCALLTGIIAGHDPLDAATATDPVPDYLGGLEDGAGGLRVAVPANYFLDGMTADTARLFQDAIDGLRRAGAEIVEVTLPDMDLVIALASIVIAVEAAAFHAPWFHARPGDYTAQTRARLEAGFHHPATRYLHALSLRGKLLAGFAAAAFAKADAVIAPVLVEPVPTIVESDVGDGPLMASALGKLTRNARPINYLGLPALSVPAGFTANGLPFGVQLVGRPFDEATLFRLGRALEREMPWHERAPLLPA